MFFELDHLNHVLPLPHPAEPLVKSTLYSQAHSTSIIVTTAHPYLHELTAH